jgi:hypothetical protein
VGAIVVLTALGLAGPAPGAVQPPPDDDESLDDIAGELMQRPEAAGALYPSATGEEGVPLAGAGASDVVPLLAEGTFIVQRAGRVIPAGTGGWQFVPAPGLDGRWYPPMLLVPCRELERFEDAYGERAAEMWFEVSGQVLVHARANFLLPDARQIRPVPRPEFLPSGGVEGPRPEAGESVPSAGTDRLPVEAPADELIERLTSLRPRTTAREPDERSGPLREVAGVRAAMEDGTLITRRRGRLARTPSGDWAISFDRDARSEGPGDDLLLIVPCLMLAELERLAGTRGLELGIEISGRVLAYRGRNLLLPMIYRILPPTDIASRQ